MNDMHMRHQRGFTLIEMIGVLAVIAILAAIVAPKIFDAISDSKIDSLVEEISTVRTATASYYKDTGVFPYNQNYLLAQKKGIKGWNGPYLDKKLTNPINPSGYFEVGQGNWNFDINGDGVNDYGTGTNKPIVGIAHFNGLTTAQAKEISNIIDGDGESTSWFSAGRVRTNNSQDPGNSTNVTLYVFLAGR